MPTQVTASAGSSAVTTSAGSSVVVREPSVDLCEPSVDLPAEDEKDTHEDHLAHGAHGGGGQRSMLYHALSRSMLVALGYLALLSVSGFTMFVPFDSFFAIFLLWAGARAGAKAAELASVPRLLGMLCMGIALKNIGDPVRNMPDEWSSAIRSFGLMNILMRGGLEMDFVAVKRLGMAVVRLTVCPGVSEAFTVACVSMGIFGMPFPLGLALGFILGAVSPAVVVGGMFDLQQRNYGVEKGVPSLVVAAASFDDVVAISGFSLCIGFAVGSGDLAMMILHGPLEIILGVGSGFCGAYICALTKLWDEPLKRSVLVVILGACYMFIFKALHFSGAGALAALVMAARSSQLWEAGWGGPLSDGPDEHIAHEVEHDLAGLWRSVCEPLLFSVIGSALDFGALDPSLIPSSIAVILCGVFMRTFAASGATFGAGLNKKERAFVALAWMPKATVQAALGAVPLELIRKNFADDPEKLAEYEKFGMSILTTAVFSIIITAPAGLIIIQQLGPRWLEHNPPGSQLSDGAEYSVREDPEWCAWGMSCCVDEYSMHNESRRASVKRVSARLSVGARKSSVWSSGGGADRLQAWTEASTNSNSHKEEIMKDSENSKNTNDDDAFAGKLKGSNDDCHVTEHNGYLPPIQPVHPVTSHPSSTNGS